MTLGRRAAIGATSVALLLAATGTSLAAVRATRYEGGVAASGMALPAAAVSGTKPGPERTFPPASEQPVVPDGLAPQAGGSADPGAAGAPSPPVTAAPQPSASGNTASRTARRAPAGQPTVGTPVRPASSATVATLGPASGPTPTTGPARSCPSDSGAGALPVRTGQLQAVDFALPWPGLQPLVLYPQASASRPSGAAVRIAEASGGVLPTDGSSLSLASALGVTYSLEAGQQRARGSVRFNLTGATVNVNVEKQACRNRRLALYDVGRSTLDGSAVRIVGMVAAPGTVTLSPDGGIAHFQAGGPGKYNVTLLTASDAGAAGRVVTVTIHVA